MKTFNLVIKDFLSSGKIAEALSAKASASDLYLYTCTYHAAQHKQGVKGYIYGYRWYMSTCLTIDLIHLIASILLVCRNVDYTTEG